MRRMITNGTPSQTGRVPFGRCAALPNGTRPIWEGGGRKRPQTGGLKQCLASVITNRGDVSGAGPKAEARYSCNSITILRRQAPHRA